MVIKQSSMWMAMIELVGYDCLPKTNQLCRVEEAMMPLLTVEGLHFSKHQLLTIIRHRAVFLNQ